MPASRNGMALIFHYSGTPELMAVYAGLAIDAGRASSAAVAVQPGASGRDAPRHRQL